MIIKVSEYTKEVKNPNGKKDKAEVKMIYLFGIPIYRKIKI